MLEAADWCFSLMSIFSSPSPFPSLSNENEINLYKKSIKVRTRSIFTTVMKVVALGSEDLGSRTKQS